LRPTRWGSCTTATTSPTSKNYLTYFEEARVAYLRHVGHPFTEWRDAGLESPVLESFVQYRKPLNFDDEIKVGVSLAKLA